MLGTHPRSGAGSWFGPRNGRVARPVAAMPEPGARGEQHAAAKPEVCQVERRGVERHVEPVHDPAVQWCGRASETVQEIAGRTGGGERGTGSLSPTLSPGRPEPEQDDASKAGSGQKRLVSGGEAEGSTVIDDQLKPQQATGDRDPVPVAEGRKRPGFARGVSGQPKKCYSGAPQGGPGRRGPGTADSGPLRRPPRPAYEGHHELPALGYGTGEGRPSSWTGSRAG